MPCSRSCLPVPPFLLCPAAAGLGVPENKGPRAGARRPSALAGVPARGRRLSADPPVPVKRPARQRRSCGFPGMAPRAAPTRCRAVPAVCAAPSRCPWPGAARLGRNLNPSGAAPPFLVAAESLSAGMDVWKGLGGSQAALRCCPGQSDSFCAFFRGQEKGVKTRGSDAFWGIPRSPGEGAPLRCRSGTARASHRVGGNTWIRAWIRGASLKGGAEGRIFVPGSSSRKGPCWLPRPRWAESSDLGRMGCQF
ncbi:uncharacterized protein LOC128944671 [Melozone crissalis]|uniref:uncharacterized protein LOC128944671 n=1 Tax=Melozone crissalis TaxID=40204 RepID=UPI0023DAB296|nr:uncharacterized protein LOC128944671 [Melozone crissalis]